MIIAILHTRVRPLITPLIDYDERAVMTSHYLRKNFVVDRTKLTCTATHFMSALSIARENINAIISLSPLDDNIIITLFRVGKMQFLYRRWSRRL